MDCRTITTLALKLAPFAPLGKTRLQTLCHLILAMVSARTVNLTHLRASAVGSCRSPLCQGSCPLLYFSLFFGWAG